MIELRVIDMACGSCVIPLTEAIKSVDPNAQVEFDMEQRLVRVESTADIKRLQEAIHGAGNMAVTPDANITEGKAPNGCC